MLNFDDCQKISFFRVTSGVHSLKVPTFADHNIVERNFNKEHSSPICSFLSGNILCSLYTQINNCANNFSLTIIIIKLFITMLIKKNVKKF